MSMNRTYDEYIASGKKPAGTAEVWNLVVQAADEMRTVTYGEIAEPLGMGKGMGIRFALGFIEEICKRNRWPPLNYIVVNKESRRPGDWVDASEPAWRAQVLAVFAFPWKTVALP